MNRAGGFEILARDGKARRGELRTDHGVVDTPVFMPVGTRGTVKGMTPDRLVATGSNMILGNTYHLFLRPGSDRIARLGGLHRFAGWDGALLTDSGGYQVFSLAALRKIDDHGVRFQSHIDGSTHVLTPERSMSIQAELGADVVMAFDECPALPAPTDTVRAAVDRTLLWAQRSLEAFGPRRRHEAGHEQVLFAIVQGGLLEEERGRCAEALAALDLPGYAIGGLSVGEAKADLHHMTAVTAPLLPTEKPRYLMGVGFPEDILLAVESGVDMFDCVLPTRMARHGTLLTYSGRLILRNARYSTDDEPVEAGCPCYACSRFSRAYMRHLIQAGEILGLVLATEHNLTFYQRLMQDIRRAIEARTLRQFAQDFLGRYRERAGSTG